MTTKLPLRPNVCMLLFNSEKKLFMGERMGEVGIWQFPQGGVEDELSIEENVLKELEEEVGVKPELLKIIKQLDGRYDYDFDTVPEYAKGRWRGQSQTYWLVEFLGSDKDVNLVSDHQEFMNWGWYTLEQVREVAQPWKLKGYELVLGQVEGWFNRFS